MPGGRKFGASNATDNIMRSPDARARRSDTRMKANLISLALAVSFAVASVVRAQDRLPSWNETASKKAIVDFVQRVTKEGAPDFVRPEERIATFDNDGTLWVEQPIYFQVLFMRDRVKAVLPQHPEWRHREPFASLLRDDIQAVAKMGEDVPKLMAATHSGIITDEFIQIVMNWVSTAKHPTTGRSFIDMVYQPMIELPRVPARKRIQDMHHLRWRDRFHAGLGRESIWDSP